MIICATFKVSNVKTLYDYDDLVKKVRVKLMTCNKKVLPLCILSINIKPVPQMVTDLRALVYPIGYHGKIEL